MKIKVNKSGNTSAPTFPCLKLWVGQPEDKLLVLFTDNTRGLVLDAGNAARIGGIETLVPAVSDSWANFGGTITLSN